MPRIDLDIFDNSNLICFPIVASAIVMASELMVYDNLVISLVDVSAHWFVITQVGVIMLILQTFHALSLDPTVRVAFCMFIFDGFTAAVSNFAIWVII